MNSTMRDAPIEANNDAKIDYKILIKCVIILVIILSLLIPVNIIMGLVEERAELQKSVTQEVTEKWGQAQSFTTPLLMLPIVKSSKSQDGSIQYYTDKIYVAPSVAKWSAPLTHETKYRSLYEVQIYQGKMTLNFNFKNIDWSKYDVAISEVKWTDAALIFGCNDPMSITSSVQLTGMGTPQELLPFKDNKSVLTEGFELKGITPQIWNEELKLEFNYNGSESINFIPLANQNVIQLQANYPHPSFVGRILPKTNAVTKEGFQAEWQTMGNLRSLPQAWVNQKPDFNSAKFGVYFKEMNDNYAQTERILKYAILFLGMTFGVFFLMETLYKLQVHPLQYLLVGLALVIFYTLLLSFSEHIKFVGAYAIAAMATVVLIAAYVKAIFGKWKIGLGFAGGLIVLYMYVYFLIQLEDMALLFGSIALFFLIGLIMYFTKDLNKKKNISLP